MIMFGKMKAGSLAAVASATFLAASGMLCSMNAAYAQYVGPSQVRQYNNVAEILKNPRRYLCHAQGQHHHATDGQDVPVY